MRIGWHLDGMGFEQYKDLTQYERWVLHEELGEMIAEANTDDLPPGRPKDWRR